MNSLIYLTTALLVLTKLLDVLSTLGRITHPDIETNPLARPVMQKIGVKAASWLVFAVAVAIIACSGFAALYGPFFYQVLFILLGIAISVIQAAVALNNHTGRTNQITSQIFRLHQALQRRL